ncbi:MAG: hypothetical protein R3F62_17730 [Planctomycetota bacterium]
MKAYAGIGVGVVLLLVGAAVARRGGPDPALRVLLGSYALQRMSLGDDELEDVDGTLTIEATTIRMSLEAPEHSANFLYTIEESATSELKLKLHTGQLETWTVKRVGAELVVTVHRAADPRQLVLTWERSGGR